MVEIYEQINKKTEKINEEERKGKNECRIGIE
jgi:hypothetical protein